MLVDDYEGRRWPIAPADPVEMIRYVMEQRGLSRKDLEAGARLARPRARDPEPAAPPHLEDGVAACMRPSTFRPTP
jgi:hypothetical protein